MSDESSVHYPRKLVKQFILLYKELECLWNRQCPGHKAKLKRHEAITQLTRLVQTYDPAATRVHVLRKIDSLRACVRREFKKVVDSRLIANSETEVYVPQLWYYELFSFLLRQEEDEESKKSKKRPKTVRVEPHLPEPIHESSEEEEVESEDPQSDDIKPEPSYEADYVAEYNPCPSSANDSPPRRSTNHEEPRRKRSRPRGPEGSSGVDDEYDAIGINVAAKLRNLPDNMRILAEKLISDVLFQAQTNGLTSSTVLMTPDPFH